MLMASTHLSKDTVWQTIKKEDPTIYCLQNTHLIDRKKHWLKVKGWKNIYKANDTRKQAGVAILITDKVDFKPQ
jgi:exonuclease III